LIELVALAASFVVPHAWERNAQLKAAENCFKNEQFAPK
jgi:hypothetical protein